ncbi:MAG: hypothetical protein IID45_14280 [Planctomycetes bacterium]|nr:hypothetical protein [Planctomycetota bacterium]
MSRTLSFALSGVLLCALVSATALPLAAQSRKTTPSSVQNRRPRPQGQTLRVTKVDPKLMRVLKAWHRGTGGVMKLEGYYSRYIYEKVFGVEKRAVGRFYYATPDKGRIDISPARIKSSDKSLRLDKDGMPYVLQADREEQWICNGIAIFQIDPRTKKGQKFDIPPRARGRNIMESQLPFLLGMPPRLALQRYHLKLLKETDTEIWLDVKPKWKQDREIYEKARVILKKNNHYLPSAVQMFQNDKNLETVYTFYRMVVNKKVRIIFPERDPFLIPRDIKIVGGVGGALSGARRSVQGSVKIPQRNKQTVEVKKKKVPELRGLSHTAASKYLKSLGFAVKIHKGSVTTDTKKLYHVEEQHPQALTPYSLGRIVHLRLFVRASDLKRTAAKQR